MIKRIAPCFALPRCCKNSQLAPLILFAWLYCSFLLTCDIRKHFDKRACPCFLMPQGFIIKNMSRCWQHRLEDMKKINEKE